MRDRIARLSNHIREYVPSPVARAALPELAVVGAITAISIAATFPMIVEIAQRIPGAAGDNLYFLWELWWFKRALIDLHVSPFVNYEVYYPVGLDLARDEITPANTILGLPLVAAFGPTITYNLLLLLSYVLSGYAAYRFVLECTGNRWASLISGVAFAVAPFRMAHLAGHLNLIATQWFALSLLFLERTFRTRRLRDAVLAGIFFGFNALAAWYYLYIGTIAAGIFIAVRSLPWQRSLRDSRLSGGAAGFVLCAVVLVIPFAFPYLQLRESGGLQRSFQDMERWSASLADFLQPTPLHPLWGNTVREIWPVQWQSWVERTLSLGWVLMPLAAFGTWAKRQNRTVQAVFVLGLASLVLALGPTLQWNGHRVEFPLPGFISLFATQVGLPGMLEKAIDPSLAAVVRDGRGFVPLPAMLLYIAIPLTSSIRVIMRFGMVAFWAATVLAGFGIAALLDRGKATGWGRRVGAMALGGLVLFDLWGGLPADRPQSTDVRPRLVDEWLASQPKPATIVEFPAIENVAATAMMHQTFNRQRMVLGGLPPSFKTALIKERAFWINAFPSQESLEAMRSWGTNYMLVTPSQFGSEAEWQKFRNRVEALSGLRLVGDVGGVLVYEIR